MKCKAWVDDVFFYCTNGSEELLVTLDKIPPHSESVEVFATAHKGSFYATESSWHRKVYSSGQVSHDSEGVQGLASMRRSRTAEELMHFLQTANRMRVSLPRVTKILEPLPPMLKEHTQGPEADCQDSKKPEFYQQCVDS